MADIRKADALVLTTVRFRETSLIVNAFAEHAGKVKLMARGARRPRSKFCGTLEPFSLDTVIYYKKEDRELYTLSDAAIIEPFDAIRRSEQKSRCALVVCELLDRTQPAGESDERMYKSSVSCLFELDHCGEPDSGAVLYGFLLLSLPLLGVGPSLESCVRCRKSLATVPRHNFSVAAGGLVCDKDYDDTVIALKPETVDAMRDLYKEDARISGAETLGDVRRLLPGYLYHHLNGLHLNSLKYVK